MLDLEIGQLSLSINNCAGHEHRIHPIVLRASTILARRIEEKYGDAAPSAIPRDAAVLDAGMQLDLSRTSNEQAARAIASAWLEALVLHLEG
jgi:hypothetical protein